MRRIPAGLRWLAVSLLLAFIACSGGRPQEDGVSSTSEALSNTARVLSFEQPTADWTASGLSLQQGNPHVDGQHSAALTITKNGGKLTSVPLTSLGPISSTVTFRYGSRPT